MLSLYLLQNYNILCEPGRYVCWNCNLTFDESFREINLNELITWNFDIWEYKNNKMYVKNKNIQQKLQNICYKLLNFSLQKKINEFYNEKSILKEIVTDFFNDPNTNQKYYKKYKRYFGITKYQLQKIMIEVLKSLKKGINNIKLVTHKGEESFYFDKNNKKTILLDILVLLIKWRMGLPNEDIACLFGLSYVTVAKRIYQGTALLQSYANKFLINTPEKLKEESPYFEIAKLMGIEGKKYVVMGDGVRFKCQSSQHFQSQQFSYDGKHKYNAYNCIGFNTCRSGKYVGFYPKSGTGSDGHHWDGWVLDFLILNNVDNILHWLKVNSSPFKDDGIIIIFDRAVAKGCVTLTEGVVTYKTPCLSIHKHLTTKSSNENRTDATSIRFGIEKCFGNLGNIFKIFSAKANAISGFYVPIFGIWLDEAAAICNHLGIGLYQVKKQRKKELHLMELKKKQDFYNEYMNNPYNIILSKFKEKKIFNNFWIQANDINHLIKNSPYWTLNKLNKLFNLNEKQLRKIGGGPYTFEMGKWYLIHSRLFIKIYFSNHKDYKEFLLVRGIKPKFTRDWDKNHGMVRGKKKKKANTTDDLVVEFEGETWISKFHSVLLGCRKGINQIQNVGEYKHSHSVLNLHYGCSCVHGSRTINADSHGICAIMYIQQFIRGITIIKNDSIAKKKWRYCMDINHFKSYLNDLKNNYLQIYINRFISNRKKIQPLNSFKKF